MKMMKRKWLVLCAFFLVVVSLQTSGSGQSTEFSFTGRLPETSPPANAVYDFQFSLWSSFAGGIQQGATLTRNNVETFSGEFTVLLNFGSQFPGPPRFLEIAYRPLGSVDYTPFPERQTIASVPYAMRSLTSIGADSVLVEGIPAGSGNYIQNQPGQQPESEFNISGRGTAHNFNAITQYNINGTRVLAVPGAANTFAGVGAGTGNTGSGNAFFGTNAGGSLGSGFQNAFFGSSAGERNTSGQSNSFVGYNAGTMNTEGRDNSFYGALAGSENVVGSNNSFFGRQAGSSNRASGNSFYGSAAGTRNVDGINNAFFGFNAGTFNTGSTNSFFGKDAGVENESGNGNSFFGGMAGDSNKSGGANTFIGSFSGGSNSTGSNNTFVGTSTGPGNLTGSSNTLLGSFANVIGSDLSNATAIGTRAAVSSINSLVLGSINGVNGATVDTNVGIGTTSPLSRLDVRGNLFVGLTQTSDAPGSNNLFIRNDGGDQNNSFRLDGSGNNFFIIARSGAGSTQGAAIVFRTGSASAGEANRMIINPAGSIVINTLATGGGSHVCRNSLNEISLCSGSSLLNKTNIESFDAGMSFIRQLRPISFDWKDSGLRDIGFGAEDIEKIDPRFVLYDASGAVEGIKYDRMSVAFVNTFREQQKQIEDQKKEIDELRSIVCELKPTAKACTKERNEK